MNVPASISIFTVGMLLGWPAPTLKLLRQADSPLHLTRRGPDRERPLLWHVPGAVPLWGPHGPRGPQDVHAHPCSFPDPFVGPCSLRPGQFLPGDSSLFGRDLCGRLANPGPCLRRWDSRAPSSRHRWMLLHGKTLDQSFMEIKKKTSLRRRHQAERSIDRLPCILEFYNCQVRAEIQIGYVVALNRLMRNAKKLGNANWPTVTVLCLQRKSFAPLREKDVRECYSNEGPLYVCA